MKQQGRAIKSPPYFLKGETDNVECKTLLSYTFEYGEYT